MSRDPEAIGRGGRLGAQPCKNSGLSYNRGRDLRVVQSQNCIVNLSLFIIYDSNSYFTCDQHGLGAQPCIMISSFLFYFLFYGQVNMSHDPEAIGRGAQMRC